MIKNIAIVKGICRHPMGYVRANPLLVSSAIFFISSTCVNLGNYLFNLVMGRWLGPVLFADVSLIITIMLVMTFMTTALSTTIAWFVATSSDQPERVAALRVWCLRIAWIVGFVVAFLLIVSASLLQKLFHMHSLWPFVILGLGFPIFFVLAVERGVLQGRAFFGWLALSNQVEMCMRLGGSLCAVLLGWSINGIVAMVALSFFVAWLPARHARIGLSSAPSPFARQEYRKVIRYFGPVLIGLLGQIVINNSDVLIVKVYFPARQAGLYAALALIGRIVYFATWSVVILLFPIIARKYQRGEPHRPWLWVLCGCIFAVSGAIVLVSRFAPDLVVQVLFGRAYLAIAPLLWLYALATACYTLANGITNYYLSLGQGLGNYLVLGASIAQVLGLLLFHQNLLTVVMVQVVLMAALFVVLLLADRYLDKRARNQSFSRADTS